MKHAIVPRSLFVLFVTALLIAAAAAIAAPAPHSDRLSDRHAAVAAISAPAPDRPVYEIPEILVTAPPIVEEVAVTRFATAQAVVSSRQVDDLAAQDLSSALRRVPGVSITRYNVIGSFGGGDGGAFTIRGQGSGRPGAEITTFYDGIPRVAGIWSHPLLDIIPMDGIDRIEIEKSAQPVLLGNMSFASVNVVPRRRMTDGFETRLEASGGKHDTGIALFEHGGKRGAFDYFATASRRHSDGHRRSAEGTVRSLSGRVGWNANGGGGADRGAGGAGPWSLSFQALHTDGDVQDPGSTENPWPRATDPTFRVPAYGTDNELYLATASHRSVQTAGEVKLYFEDGRADWRQWDTPVPPPDGWEPGRFASFTTLTTSQNYGVRAKEAFAPRPGAEVVLGLDQGTQSGKATEKWPFGNRLGRGVTFRSTSPYLMARQTFGHGSGQSSDQSSGESFGKSHGATFAGGWRFTPSVGARYTDSREFSGHWGWQTGTKAERGAFAAYANYSRAFNLPGSYVVVLYDLWGRPGEWKSLEAERLDHGEVGISMSWPTPHPTHLTVSAFHDEVKDALRFVPPVIPPPPPFQPPRFENRGGYITRGIEGNLSVGLTSDLDFFTGGTWNDPTPETVPNLPEWSWVSGLGWIAARSAGASLKINLDASYVGSQYVLNPRFAPAAAFLGPSAKVDGHFLLNGRVAYGRALEGAANVQMEIFAAGENLTNESYSYRPGYPMPRATWLSGIDVRF